MNIREPQLSNTSIHEWLRFINSENDGWGSRTYFINDKNDPVGTPVLYML